MGPRAAIAAFSEELREGLENKLDHFIAQAGIHPNEKGVSHDPLGLFERTTDTTSDVLIARLLEDVSPKDLPRFDLGLL